MRYSPHPSFNDPLHSLLLTSSDDDPLLDTDENDRLRFLRTVPILSDLGRDDLVELARRAVPEVHLPGVTIFDEGDDSDSFYIIESGRVHVVQRKRDGTDKVLARLSDTNYFGELGLLLGQARSASIHCVGEQRLRVLRFDEETFLSYIGELVVTFRMKRLQRRMEHRRALSPRLTLLEGMPAEQLDLLARSSREDEYGPDMVVFEQDSAADRFYFLLRGEVAVERDGVELARLPEGSFFGETALLFNTGRTATVRTTQPTLLWSVDHTVFQRVVAQVLLGNHTLMPTVLSRLQSTNLYPGPEA